MPTIKSSKKRVTQSLKRQARNYNTRTAMKKAIRRVEDTVKSGEKKSAEAALTAAYKIIDTATKKNVIQKNTASRRKSKLARSLSGMEEKAKAKKAADDAVSAKKTAKKEAAKKVAPKKKKVVKEETKAE